jgi:hypothetical protein
MNSAAVSISHSAARTDLLLETGVHDLGSRREHPIDCREMAPGIGQDFSIGGMIGVLDGDDAAAQLRMFLTQVVRELLLGLRRPDYQYLVRALESLCNFIKKLVIGGRFVAAVIGLAAVYTLMLVMRMDHGVRLLRRGEMPGGRLLVIDPNDGVIV